jgi:hypothetical protein
MKQLNKSTISDFIYPPEETFICLVLSKYILTELQKLGESVAPYEVDTGSADKPAKRLPVEPWKGAKADSVDLQDLDFFFSRQKRVHSVWLANKQVKNKSERDMYLDFSKEIAELEAQDADMPDLATVVTEEDAQGAADLAPIPAYENYGFFESV